MEVSVLGPVEARLDGRVVGLGTPKQRALVAALALSRGRPVAVDTIVDLLWDEQPPPGVTTTLQAYISGLRRVLEPARQRRSPATVLVTVAPGYALRLSDEDLDAAVFERQVTRMHRVLAVLATARLPERDLVDARSGLDDALSLWRGTPFSELEHAPAAIAERARLEELRLVALEDRAVAELALGQHATVAAELESLTGRYPLRERLWSLRSLALTRAGRQAEALDVLRQIRDVLDTELGIEPSAELRELQTAVLRQDASLAWVPPPSDSAVASSLAAPSSDLPSAADPSFGWPLVGRTAELAALHAALHAAMSGTPTYAVLTGDPGIGKSRLSTELTAAARAAGARVLVGRGSQDDGAPPLWPWATVLESLDAELPSTDASDEGSQFRTFEQITRLVRRAAREQPTVVVLDDLHWADAASLRVLRLLAETARDESLMLLTTWRAHPEPSGALADVAEALARRHALRLELSGLPTVEAARVFEAIAQATPTSAQAEAIRERTDGNPFFLVEYARLAGDRPDLDQLLQHEPPTAVQEVVARRLTRLPDGTVDVLRLAAVVGREFDSTTVAAATGIDEDDLLDVIDPAQAAGLVREEGVDRFSFSHALVRETLYSGLSVSRRARAHRRVAEALRGTPGRETELARHWRAAGPPFAGEAWRACLEAAAVAKRLHANEQRVELLTAALAAMDEDPQVAPRERFDALMLLVDAQRWAVMWLELPRTVERAVDVAEAMGDPVLVAEAGVAAVQGALWQTGGRGQTNPQIIDTLRRSLSRLPATDSPLRCRSMLALAMELYYASRFEERRALVDEALAMAHRIGDDRLTLDACQLAYQALWQSGTAPERLELATTAVELAGKLADAPARAAAGTLRAVVLGELGRPREMWEVRAETLGDAERLRLPYVLLVLDTMALPWLAMAGRFEECRPLVVRIQRIDQTVSLAHSSDASNGALISLAMWEGKAGEAADLVASLTPGAFPLTATVVTLLARGGRPQEAREYYATHAINLEHDDWFSMHAWCMVAEASLVAGDAAMAAAVYAKLAPFSRRCCTAGSGNASGPVDAFLALAAAAAGEREQAARHAEDALAMAQEWDIPLAAQWLRDQRQRYSF